MNVDLINEIDLLKNALGIADENRALREKILKLNSVVKQMFFHLENQHILHGKSFPKQDVIKNMVQKIDSFDDQIRSLAINNVDDNMIDQVKPGIERIEFALFLHRETEKMYRMNQDLFEQIIGVAYWLLRYSKKYHISLPNSNELSKILKNEGFSKNYQPMCDYEKNQPTKSQNVVIGSVSDTVDFFFVSHFG